MRGLRDPEFRALFVGLVGLLISGTIFYAAVEGWQIVDSLYFWVMTLSAVGYGGLHPTTPVSKIFTIIYLVVGMGIFVGLITKVAEQKRNRNIMTKRGGKTREGGTSRDDTRL